MEESSVSSGGENDDFEDCQRDAPMDDERRQIIRNMNMAVFRM
jgi:hypothetical protein